MSDSVNSTLHPSISDPARLTPEAVMAQPRDLRLQIDDVAPLSKQQRRLIKQRVRMQSTTVVEASINVLGVLDNISQAISSRSTQSVSCRTRRSAGTPWPTRLARS